jgi:hypothetical protein
MAKKNSSTWVVGPLSVLTMGSLMFTPAAHPQVVGATAKSTTAPSATQGQIQSMQSQIQMMQGQVQALVARVKSLEDQAQLASSGPDEAKPGKSLETRLEALEREQAKESAHEEKGGDAKNRPEKLTVVAPFTVVDEEGKIIMRVGEQDSNFSRGIYAYNENGLGVAYMGESAMGGRFYAKRPESSGGELVFGIGPNGPTVLIYNAGNKQFELGRESLAFYGDGNSVLSLFGTKNRVKGYLELNDSNGIMVEAGALDDHKGYVLANPYRPSPELRGDPSVLKGGTRAN